MIIEEPITLQELSFCNRQEIFKDYKIIISSLIIDGKKYDVSVIEYDKKILEFLNNYANIYYIGDEDKQLTYYIINTFMFVMLDPKEENYSEVKLTFSCSMRDGMKEAKKIIVDKFSEYLFKEYHDYIDFSVENDRLFGTTIMKKPE
jgi:hypothetical protein